MSTPNAISSRGPLSNRPAALMLLIAALVAGIFGMHGLVSHGDCSPGAAMAAPIVAVDEMSSVAMDLSSGTTGRVVDQVGTSATHLTSHEAPSDAVATMAGSVRGATTVMQGTGGMGAMGGMLMLCVAVLTAVAGLLLLCGLLLRARSRGGLALLRVGTTVARRLLRPARTGPPAVWEFSVIRC